MSNRVKLSVAVLGATGKTGKSLVNQLLDREHKVKALVRTPEKLNDVKNKNLNVIEANIFSEDDLMEHLSDVDLVISTLGFSFRSKPVKGYSEIAKVLVKSMNNLGKTRLILMHGVLTDPNSRDEPKGVTGFLVRKISVPMIKSLLDNMHEAEEYLRRSEEARSIVWTTVLPVGLKNGSVTRKHILAEEGKHSAPNGTRLMIARADVARYLVKVAEENLHTKNCVAIGIKK